MLRQFGVDIWIADGRGVHVAGFHYPTRMAIIRLNNGDLFVWSPVALDEDLRAEVNGLGNVRHIVAPNSLHHLSIRSWQLAYPDARVYAPPGLRKKRPDIPFDGDLADGPDAAWEGQIDQVAVKGNAITTEVVFFHPASSTVLFTDLIQHFPKGWFSGWRAVIARLDLMMVPEASVPRKFRLAFTNRRVARACVQRILEWPATKVIFAHGAPIEKDGNAFLRRAFDWLMA